MSAYVGIDVSKATLDIAMQQAEQTTHFQVANTPDGFQHLRQRLALCPLIERVGLEASGRYGEAVAHDLFAAGYAVSYINPKQIHDFAQVHLHYNKTDKQDAILIARFCQLHQPLLWQPNDPLYQQLQQQTRFLRSLETNRQQERNRLQSGLTDATVQRILQEHIDYLTTQIERLQRTIRDLIKHHATLKQQHKLLTSIPGIAHKSASVLLAEIGDISQFDNARQLAAWVGITPRHFQSGSSVKRPSRISKQGNIHLRTALYMPAISARRWNPFCRALTQRLQQRNKHGIAINIAVMRQLLHQVFGILKSGRPFDPTYQNLIAPS
jgi:transposase